MKTVDVDTPHGSARAHVERATAARGALVLGHGAGGGVASPDLQTARDAAVSEGLGVVLVEQPYRVAGRRSPAPAAQLDAAWTSVAEQLSGGPFAGLPLLCGGRSAGARVACRTAAATGGIGGLCLAFPLHPPGRPEKTRLPELEAVDVPVLIVQGNSDPFGMPPDGPGREVARIAGNHSLASDMPGLRAAVAGWLAAVLA